METKKTLAEYIRELGDAGKYGEQGRVFLEKTCTTIDVIEAVPQGEPLWISETGGHYTERGAKPIHYSITLKNARHSYTFDFWGSINDAEMVELAEKTREAVKPSAYSILACLKDSAGDSFEDFCANYGYDTDSRTAERTRHAVLEQERNVRKLFTHDEIEALAEIA